MSRSRQADLRELIARPFAHRGLHGDGRIENSRAAFAAAIAAGDGIELDVQAGLYGVAFVFHDYQLDRLAEGRGPLIEREPEDLARIRLKGSDETIPELRHMLSLIAGQVPLLIEVKTRSRLYHQLCYSVAWSLRGYRGPVGVMSFNPRVGRWFARHYPQLLRGLVVSEQGKAYIRGKMERWFSLWRARPDFLAYDIRDLPSRFAAASGLPVVTWTVRGEDDRARAAQFADQIIYEAAPG